MRCLRTISTLALMAFLACGAMTSCKPRVKIRPRMPKLSAKKAGTRSLAQRRRLARTGGKQRAGRSEHPARAARKRPSVLRRFTDFQTDNLIEGLLQEAAGVEDVQERYQRLSREKQLAVLRRVRAQPKRRDARFAMLRSALR